MPEIRLVATDIDGSLANDAREIPPYSRRVLQTLVARAIPVAVVTGLNPWPARRYVEQIDSRVIAIIQNGVFVMEQGQCSERRMVDPQVARESVALILECGYVPLVYGTDDVTRYLPMTEGMEVATRLIASRPYQPYQVVEAPEALLAVPVVQVSVCDTEQRVRALYPLLMKALGNRASVVLQPQPSHQAWVEVYHPEVRKAVALLALAARLGIAPEEIIYFGDSLNDLEVMRAVGYPVAMGNALPEVKAVAWRVAPSNNEEGVARVLAELFGI
jgi:Cof subfamily protein (haloacid dehalogenase superfamily)